MAYMKFLEFQSQVSCRAWCSPLSGAKVLDCPAAGNVGLANRVPKLVGPGKQKASR